MGYRIDSYKQHKENQEEFQKTQARQHNGQARGDLRAPNTQDPRYNYNTYKEDYFCVHGDEIIPIVRNGYYTCIKIKEFDDSADKVLSIHKDKIVTNKARLYKYKTQELKTVRVNGETHNITNNHKFLYHNESGIDYNGKVPELNDVVPSCANYEIPSLLTYPYIDFAFLNSKDPKFHNNKDGTFSLVGQGYNPKFKVKYNNTISLDEDLCFFSWIIPS